jgi:uncharacterized protein YodC (DUF2158 family)
MKAKFETSQGIQVIENVTVTSVRKDGTFSIKWPNGAMPDCSSGYVRLYDENDVEVQPVVEQTTEDNLKTRLQAAESALLFLMDINMGGML